MELDRRDGAGVRAEVGEQLAGGEVPQLEQTVLAGRRDPAAVGAEANTVHAAAVTLCVARRCTKARSACIDVLPQDEQQINFAAGLKISAS